MLRYEGLFCADNDCRHCINLYDYRHDTLNSRRYDYIIPRETLFVYENYWGLNGSNINDMSSFIQVPWRYLKRLEENECIECPYSEGCDGQMCFFSMI